jgi:hypothetical protein
MGKYDDTLKEIETTIGKLQSYMVPMMRSYRRSISWPVSPVDGALCYSHNNMIWKSSPKKLIR